MNLSKRAEIALPVLYVILRFGFDGFIDGLSPWGMYAVELLFVAWALMVHGRELRALGHLPKVLTWVAPVVLVSGVMVALGAKLMGLPIPLQAFAPLDMILLLVIAPLLEEMLFRFFLWIPFEKRGKPSAGLIATTLLFSYAHAHSIWSVPAEWHDFIYYQTAYTLALGIVCGFMVWRWRSWVGAYLLHLAFNLGFWLALFF